MFTKNKKNEDKEVVIDFKKFLQSLVEYNGDIDFSILVSEILHKQGMRLKFETDEKVSIVPINQKGDKVEELYNSMIGKYVGENKACYGSIYKIISYNKKNGFTLVKINSLSSQRSVNNIVMNVRPEILLSNVEIDGTAFICDTIYEVRKGLKKEANNIINSTTDAKLSTAGSEKSDEISDELYKERVVLKNFDIEKKEDGFHLDIPVGSEEKLLKVIEFLQNSNIFNVISSDDNINKD